VAEWPCCHDPLRFSPVSLRFVPPPIHPSRSICPRKHLEVRLGADGDLEQVRVCQVCAVTCLGGRRDMPRCVPFHALVCAVACLGVCRGMPWCAPWLAHGVTGLAMACLGVCHGQCQPRLVCALVCAMAMPTEVSGLPMGCHGFPQHALVCAMACLGVCHDKSCACQIDFCPCKPPKLCF
jgi:hypothetical protein